MIFFKRNKDIHFDLYYKIVNISRNKDFYSKFKVPDTTDGRFEILLLHLIILIRKLKKDRKEHLSQSIVDLMFSSIDLSFREEGVGDLSIPKKMKKVGMVFYGRSTSLEDIMDIQDILKKKNLLGDFFLRNAFSSDPSYNKNANELSKYTIAFEQLIENVNIEEIPKLNTKGIK
tara:strand:+ start:621 stop:1142 length:522 start_codon:yes stop_codon:yes gene_type:complete